MGKRGNLLFGIVVLLVILALVFLGWFESYPEKISGRVINSGVSCEEGVIAYYNFENNANDLATDKTGQIYDATFAEGKLGIGIQFDGDDDYVKISRANIEPENITLSVWIYLEKSEDLFSVVLDKPSSNTLYENPYYDYHLRFDQANGISPRLFASFVTGAAHSLADDILLSKQRNLQNSWSHLAMSYDGERMKVYINGEREKLLANAGKIIYHGTDLYLGRYKNLETGDFKGKMDELVVYDRALSDSEIKRLYNKGNGLAVCETTPPTPDVETPKVEESEFNESGIIVQEEAGRQNLILQIFNWLKGLFS